MTITIKDGERGLLYKNGVFVRALTPGKHRFFGPRWTVETVEAKYTFAPPAGVLDTYLRDPDLAAELEVVEVPDRMLGLHYMDGRFNCPLRSGKYAFWKTDHTHETRMVDMGAEQIGEDVPAYILPRIPQDLYLRADVADWQVGRLYRDGRFVRLLPPGTYRFWKAGGETRVELTDTRLRQLTVQGQELLTMDKVAIRCSFACRYRITDCVRVNSEIDDFEEQIHVLAQLALREYVGRSTLDALLENKELLGEYVYDTLKKKESELFVTFTDAGVKDIILPGEIREIMNTVLITEKRAQANVITRREEVASTRSLLNTAKLMEENRTLMHLKEMEHLERICDNVGNITVNGGSGLLEQLSAIAGGGTA
jgi:regulator of protease activity HflC (stomatin/prohibitin superfamily)